MNAIRSTQKEHGVNFKWLSSQFTGCFLVGLILGMFCNAASAQCVTWIKPSRDTKSGLQLSSVVKHVSLGLYDAAGKPVKSINELGWKYEDYKLGPALRAGRDTDSEGNLLKGGDKYKKWGLGKETKITVSNLPPGEHEVFLRYWAKAPGPEQRWYAFNATVSDKSKFRWLDYKAGKIVNGLGGYEPTIYEAKLGVVGKKTKDATEVNVRFRRSQFVRVTRFCGIRIESHINADSPKTSGADLSKEEQTVRRKLLATGAAISKDLSCGLGVVPSTLKVRPKTFDALVDVPINDQFDISGARGEWVNEQLVVFSPDRDLNIRSLEVKPLVNTETGKKIEATDLLFAPVGFLRLDKSFDLETNGWWPEPIMPFLTKDFTIAKGDVQPLWLRVHIPQNTLAGLYEGSVSIVPKNGAKATVPVHLKVYDFNMPKQFSFRVVGSARKSNEDILLSYGIAPGTIYRGSPPTREDLERWSKDERVSSFNVMYGNPDYMVKELDKRLDQIGQCLKQAEALGIRDKAYFYMYDEAKTKDIPAMRKVSKAVHERFPDLMQLTTSHVFDGGHGNHNKLPYIKGWIPGLNGYKYDWAMAARRNHGREVWWYTCNVPFPPAPNTFTVNSAMSQRLLFGFMPYAYKTDGYLNPRYDRYWHKEKTDITDGPYVRKGWQARKDGQIVQRGANGPLPSIRLELLRDGLQDYEYLKMAEANMQRLNMVDKDKWPKNLRTLSDDVKPYFNVENSLIKSKRIRDYSEDVGELEKVRTNLAKFITASNTFLKSK